MLPLTTGVSTLSEISKLSAARSEDLLLTGVPLITSGAPYTTVVSSGPVQGVIRFMGQYAVSSDWL